MELGSAEHKQLLVNNIRRTALRTASFGVFIGVLLLIPSLVRENDFSSGLAYLGWAFIIGFVSYSLWLSYRKYQKLIKGFEQQFSKEE